MYVDASRSPGTASAQQNYPATGALSDNIWSGDRHHGAWTDEAAVYGFGASPEAVRSHLTAAGPA